MSFVFEDGFSAFRIEFGDAVLFDFAFMLESELFLDFDLHRQSVRVPTRFAMDLEAAHGPVAADEILDGPRENVMDAGFAVRGRRAFVERVVGGALPGFDALFEYAVLLPVLENFLFEIGQAHFVGYLLEHLTNVTRIGLLMF